MRLSSYIACTAAIAISLWAAASQARPLRIWVMNNEAGVGSPKISECEVRRAVDRWRREGIIVENSISNLLIPAETRYPLASHILGDNSFIRQLADYRKASGDDGLIAIEFIRWDDAYSRITSALTSDNIETVPDIAQIGLSWANDLAKSGRLTNLRGMIADDVFHPSPKISDSVRAGDELYAVPWFAEMRLLYYDRSALPSAEAVADWNSFAKTCAAYTQRHGKPFIGFSTSINWNLLHNLAPWLWSAGGNIVSVRRAGPIELRSVAIDSPESITGMAYLKRLSECGCAAFPNVPQEIVDRDFAAGRYAAVITGPWITRILGEGWRRRFGVAGMPSGPGGSHPFVGGSHLIVSAASQERGNFDRAARLVKHLVSKRSQLEFNGSSGFYPVNDEALGEFLEASGDKHFMRAVEDAISYPSMSGWGEIIENDFIRSHLWHIWRDIAQGVPDETLVATAKSAARSLRTKLVLAQAKRAAPYAATALAGVFAIAAAALAWSRARYRRARRMYEANSAELARIHAERTVLEGRMLLLERKREAQSEELSKLKGELRTLNARAEELKVELARSSARKPGDERRIGPFSFGWDGSLAVRGERVRFDNNRQARRLIEHLLRRACAGQLSTHCLWGYPLFGWRPEAIQSHPQRLFEIMVAKINSALRHFGAPPIARKSGKGTLSWRFAWDVELVLANCDIRKASREAVLASSHLADGEVQLACTHIITSLELDPKSLEALAAAKDILSSSNPEQPYRSRIKSMLKISEGLVARDIESLKEGAAAVEQVLSQTPRLKGIDCEVAEGELGLMKHAAEYLAARFKSIFGPSPGARRPALLDEIMGRLSAIQEEIAAFKAKGAADEALWSQVAASQSFSQLMAVPHVSSMVSDFYNDEIDSREDPRLVKLALISALARQGSLKKIDAAKDGRALIKNMAKIIREEINALSDSLEFLSQG